MGRKKKFIDKKRSATFQLLARDTSTLPADGAAPPLADRVFVRVDNNPYSIPGLTDDGDTSDIDDDSDSIFADAPGDTDDDEGSSAPPWIGGAAGGPRKTPLPDNVRKQILELGLPDDGYNYLLHLREIKNTGGGAAYYHNSKAQLDRVQHDVKAYDASRLRISNDEKKDSICSVASKTVGVNVRRVVDLDVMKLLDDDDLSRFGSDIEDLEEDFVVKANLPEGGEELVEEEEVEGFAGEEREDERGEVLVGKDSFSREQEDVFTQEEKNEELELDEKQRVYRPLDDQFNRLILQEYDNDTDSDDAGYVDIERESRAAKIKDALKEYSMGDLELEDKYRAPGDFVSGTQGSGADDQLDMSADVIRKCMEYAEIYCNDNMNDEEVVFEESSDESDEFDCETIVSTYSNLDNHPGKIQAPENTKLRTLKRLPQDSTTKSNVIALGGKEKIPVDFLPHNRKSIEKVKTKVSSGADKHKRKLHGEESKDEKKERKAAVKEERREARKTKKELKGLYRCETQRAQKAVAISVPSSIHLM